MYCSSGPVGGEGPESFCLAPLSAAFLAERPPNSSSCDSSHQMISEVLPYDLRVSTIKTSRSDNLIGKGLKDALAQDGWTDIQPVAQKEPPNALAAINYDLECECCSATWSGLHCAQPRHVALRLPTQTDMPWTPFATLSLCRKSHSGR